MTGWKAGPADVIGFSPTDLVMNVFVASSQYSAAWKIDKISSALTNYFWLHWIYLGVVWGLAAIAGLSAWLRLLGVPSILFCWAVWIVFGQASGAYVGPKTWTVFLLAAGLSILLRREAALPAIIPPVRVQWPGRAMPVLWSRGA